MTVRSKNACSDDERQDNQFFRIREDLSQLFPSHRHARNEIVSYLHLEAEFADS